jgi:hypothetical protein
MDKTNNAEVDFLQNLKSDDIKISDNDDILGGEVKTEPKPEKVEDDDSPRNRRERRFVREMEEVRAKAQEDREARIKAEERAAAIMELGNRASSSTDPDEVKFYGDTPEGKFAKAFMEKKLKEVEERAYSRAIGEIQKERDEVAQEEAKDSQTIDQGISAVEQEFDVDLSGDTKESLKLRNGYIDFLEKLTTNDFPDFVSSFEIYQQINKKQPNENTQRQKALADRSMTSSGNTGAPQQPKFRSGRDYIDYLQHINS